MKFKKNPIVVDAFELTGESVREKRKWPVWLFRAAEDKQRKFLADWGDRLRECE